MRLKEGVILNGLNIKMRQVLIAAEKVWKKYGIEEGVTVTSGLDGCHSAGSKHYYGYALDLRTKYFTDDIKNLVAFELEASLTDDYSVIVEPSHIHVQYNRI